MTLLVDDNVQMILWRTEKTSATVRTGCPFVYSLTIKVTGKDSGLK